MNDELYLRYKAISLYRTAAEAVEPLAALTVAATDAERAERAARVFSAVADAGCDSTGEWIQKLLERDDNAFSRAAARGESISRRIKEQATAEIALFKQMSLLKPDDFYGVSLDGVMPRFGYGGLSVTYDKLSRFYASNGYGVLATASAFYYDGDLTPMRPQPLRLDDLKNYAEEKAEIVKNTENFINGLPAFHTLLYGDRGTGKSSTVRALGYEYRDRLKMIELSRDSIFDLPRLFARIDGLKQKYILFIDDLTFDESDARIDGFKAALEGSLIDCNALFYCTSNRRHLIKEGEKKERRNDDVQAELALFDRFGLVVTYIVPGKDEFLDIFKQILRARGIKWRDEYASIAELAALKKGGRSPRAAKQIADLIETTYAENGGRA